MDLEKEINWNNLSSEDKIKFALELSNYVRESPHEHQRQLKSGKVVQVKGKPKPSDVHKHRERKPEAPKMEIGIPSEKTLKRMPLEKLSRLLRMAQQMSEASNKSQVIEALYKAIRAKQKEEKQVQIPITEEPSKTEDKESEEERTESERSEDVVRDDDNDNRGKDERVD